MRRNASCHCGQLQVVCSGKPVQVIQCYCEACQRRTGSAYNLGAWFERPRVAVSGREQLYRRRGDEGIESVYHFCPACGSNVYWEAAVAFPDMVGVAVGCFADPAFPPPTLALYGARRCLWLPLPANIPCHETGLGSALE